MAAIPEIIYRIRMEEKNIEKRKKYDALFLNSNEQKNIIYKMTDIMMENKKNENYEKELRQIFPVEVNRDYYLGNWAIRAINYIKSYETWMSLNGPNITNNIDEKKTFRTKNNIKPLEFRFGYHKTDYEKELFYKISYKYQIKFIPLISVYNKTRVKYVVIYPQMSPFSLINYIHKNLDINATCINIFGVIMTLKINNKECVVNLYREILKHLICPQQMLLGNNKINEEIQPFLVFGQKSIHPLYDIKVPYVNKTNTYTGTNNFYSPFSTGFPTEKTTESNTQKWRDMLGIAPILTKETEIEIEKEKKIEKGKGKSILEQKEDFWQSKLNVSSISDNEECIFEQNLFNSEEDNEICNICYMPLNSIGIGVLEECKSFHYNDKFSNSFTSDGPKLPDEYMQICPFCFQDISIPINETLFEYHAKQCQLIHENTEMFSICGSEDDNEYEFEFEKEEEKEKEEDKQTCLFCDLTMSTEQYYAHIRECFYTE